MRILENGLAGHLAGETTTLCTCWRIMRRDGAVLGFTDHDRDLSFDETLFEAASGFRASETESQLGFAVDSQSVEGALISHRIAADDIRADRYDGAKVEAWTVNWRDTVERCLLHVFEIGATTEEDGHFRAELEGATRALKQGSGRRFIRNCDADLGDLRCGVDLDDPKFGATAVVGELLTPLVFVAEGLDGFETGWFRGGRLRFASGENLDLAVEIAEHQAMAGRHVLHLWKRPPFAIAAGDAISVTAGCAKTFDQCREKFANQLNFRGFPQMPGNDFTFGFAHPDAEMDGEPLIR